jgi:hypothetical protein
MRESLYCEDIDSQAHFSDDSKAVLADLQPKRWRTRTKNEGDERLGGGAVRASQLTSEWRSRRDSDSRYKA